MYKSIITTIAFIFIGLAIQAQDRREADFKPAAQYQLTWQRLLLQLSSTYYTVVKEGQVDLDNSLLYTSHSLGLSRLPVIAEGINDPDLLARSQWVDKRDPQAGIKMLAGLKGRQHLELLVLIGAYYAFEPFTYQHGKDTVLYYLNNAIRESKMLHDQTFERLALCLLGKMYVQGYDPKGDAIFNQVIKACHDAGDAATEAKAWAYRGLYTGFRPASTANRIIYLQKAWELYHNQGNTEGEINALTNECYLNVVSHQLDDADKTAAKALKLAEQIHFPYTHYNTDALAMVAMFKDGFGVPLKYGLETIRTAEATRDSVGWGYFYSRLAALYFFEDDGKQESMKWDKKALQRFLLAKDGGYLNLFNLTAALLGDDKPNEAIILINRVAKITPPVTPSDNLFYYLALESYYIAKKDMQLDMAEKYLLKADSVERQVEKSGISLRQGMITYKFGNFYFIKGEYLKAKTYFTRYLTYPSKTGNLDMGLNSLKFLRKIDSVFNDKNAQLLDWERYNRLRDSSFAISKIRQAEELNVKYATEEKVNQIALLNENAKLEQSNLKQATLTKNVTFGGIVLVLIIAGLLYRQSRLRQKSNELVTQKNDVITQKNELLQSLVTEKEWLLKEVHHRVKNNLHSVICLLESQAAYLENDALRAIEESQHRIYTMSLIHQKLYQSDDIKTIDMSVYIPELVQYLSDSFDVSGKIHFALSIERINLNPAQAIPFALIINEALTNSIKYAFTDNRRGEITIVMTDNRDQLKLELTDNGVGMNKNEKNGFSDSLGLELMKGLAKELKGEIGFENSNGVKITVTFEHDALDEMNLSQDFIAI